jgi:hypothetical protein
MIVWNGYQYVDMPVVGSQMGQQAANNYQPYNQQGKGQTPVYGANNTPQTNKIYVSGIEGARSYQLSPNTEMLLCDDNQNIVYDVVVDAQGKRTVTALDICVHQEQPKPDFSTFATKEDIAKLREELMTSNKTNKKQVES